MNEAKKCLRPKIRGYEKEEHAAEAYDVAALKCKGGKAGRKVKKLETWNSHVLFCIVDIFDCAGQA